MSDQVLQMRLRCELESVFLIVPTHLRESAVLTLQRHWGSK